MFTKPTTIVIGAGASFEFGIPLGATLFDAIKKDALFLAALNEGVPHSENDIKAALLRGAIKHSASRQIGTKDEIIKIAQVFSDRARLFLYNSIDRFMRENPDTTRLSKFLISLNLLHSMYYPATGGSRWNRHRTHLDLKSGKPRNWVAAFAAHLRDGIRDPDHFYDHYRKIPVRIISFNYEETFEKALSFFLKTGQLFENLEINNTITIEHCYGRFGQLPDSTDDFLSLAFENAQDIKTIFEAGEPMAKKAAWFLDEPSYFLGFSCDRENLRFLQLDSAVPKSIFVHDFSGDQRMRHILRSHGIEKVASGSTHSGLTISEFIDTQGALEDDFIDSVKLERRTYLQRQERERMRKSVGLE